MEVVLPSLIILVLVAFFAFMVLPRMGPTVLAVVSLIALIAAGVQHYSMFYTEYRLSTWQNSMVGYGPFIVLGIALIFIISAAVSVVTGKGIKNITGTPMDTISNAITNIKSSMPTAASATNMVTAGINKGLSAVAPAAPAAQAAPAAPASSMIPAIGYKASEV